MRSIAPLFTKDKNSLVDPSFKKLILESHQRVIKNDASCTFFCSGQVGSGKSTLMLIAMSILEQEEVDRIGTTDESFALAYKKYRGKKGSFIAHDEANFSSRRSSSGRNEDTSALLMSVRGENLITWFNNPSIHYIDKKFIDEGLINFFIFINERKKRYQVFSMRSMFKFNEVIGDLKFKSLLDHGGAFADYEGEFGKVKGVLWKEYGRLKKERMKEIGSEFIDKYVPKEEEKPIDTSELIDSLLG